MKHGMAWWPTLLATVVVLAGVGASATPAAATLPPGNTAQQWNAIAQEAVVTTPGMFQNEALRYMSYVQAAVYDAVTAIEGGFEPYGPGIEAPDAASADAAVVEAAYRTLIHYLPAQQAMLDPLYGEALARIPDGPARAGGIAVGDTAAAGIIALRADDGRRPVGTLTAYTPPASSGPAFWEPTPPAFLAPQTPWLKDVRPFVIPGADRFLPGPPPALDSRQWLDEYNEVKLWGRATASPRTPEQTDIARFWSINVVRQYNTGFRDLAAGRGLSLLQTARLLAIGNIAGADTQIACWNAKYRYGFWRPITAIATPGRDDGNALTEQDLTWVPTLTTPNHPEYPARARLPDLGDGRRLQRRPAHQPDRHHAHQHHRAHDAHAPLRARPRPARRDHPGAALGRPALPRLQRQGRHARAQGRALRAQPRLPAHRLEQPTAQHRRRSME